MRTASYETGKKSDAEDLATVQMATEGGTEAGIFSRDLMTGLMGMVPILGGKKVTVGFAGENAFCDQTLSYVNIPALPPADVIPLQIAREIRGFAAHEAAHIAFTDGEVFPSQIIDDQGNFDKLLKEVWNCVEDFMIEKHWLALYPGARKNFAATEVRCCRGYLEMYGKNPDVAKDLRIVGPVALTWMRSLYFNLGVAASRECLQTLPVNLRQRVMDWFRDIEDVETTQDCLEAARRIHADILADPYDPQDPPAGMPQGQGGSAQGAGQGAGQGQGASGGQGSGQNGQAGQGAGQGGQQEDTSGAPGGGGASGPGAADMAAQASGNSGPDPIPTSMDISHVLKDAGKIADNPNWITAEVLSTAQSGPIADTLASPDGRQKAESAQSEIRGTIAATANQLRRALKAVSKDRWKGGRLDGRMDHRRIAGAASGQIDFYKRKVKGEAVDTAVSILVDASGSMSGEEIAICQQLALILEGSFAGTPIKHEIVGFTCGDLSEADPAFQVMIEAHEKRGTPVCARAVNLYEFRRFDQSHFSALQTIGNMTDVPMGGTPTSDAILLTHDRLARRPEKRHVLFVLTDGAPDDPEATRDAVQAVEACGVTVVGIGIGCDAVEHLFDNAVVLGDARDLPALMMSKLSRMLIGDKAKVALKGRAAAKARGT